MKVEASAPTFQRRYTAVPATVLFVASVAFLFVSLVFFRERSFHALGQAIPSPLALFILIAGLPLWSVLLSSVAWAVWRAPEPLEMMVWALIPVPVLTLFFLAPGKSRQGRAALDNALYNAFSVEQADAVSAAISTGFGLLLLWFFGGLAILSFWDGSAPTGKGKRNRRPTGPSTARKALRVGSLSALALLTLLIVWLGYRHGLDT